MCVFKERSSPRDTQQWPITLSACLQSLNELSRSCEKGSSFLASISNKINRNVRFASPLNFIFVLSNHSFFILLSDDDEQYLWNPKA